MWQTHQGREMWGASWARWGNSATFQRPAHSRPRNKGQVWLEGRLARDPKPTQGRAGGALGGLSALT